MNAITNLDIEIEIAEYITWRRNIIVPNVSWGFFDDGRECDLVVVTPARYLWEIEIKRTLSDLKVDRHKRHCDHRHPWIRRTYFAVAAEAYDETLIPAHAGILLVSPRPPNGVCWQVEKKREARNSDAQPLEQKRVDKLLRLAAMRTWGLKRKLQKAVL